MCGIVAAASQLNIINILTNGLKHLEYRGYDSAGIAFINDKEISSYKERKCRKPDSIFRLKFNI